MFLHFGYFLRKGVFLQKGFLSAEILSFCRNATVFLQKAFGLSVFLQKPTFLQKSTSFCRNQPLSAETNLFLQKGRYFCQLRLSAENFCFLYPLFLFRPTPFRLISNCSPMDVLLGPVLDWWANIKMSSNTIAITVD